MTETETAYERVQFAGDSAAEHFGELPRPSRPAPEQKPELTREEKREWHRQREAAWVAEQAETRRLKRERQEQALAARAAEEEAAKAVEPPEAGSIAEIEQRIEGLKRDLGGAVVDGAATATIEKKIAAARAEIAALHAATAERERREEEARSEAALTAARADRRAAYQWAAHYLEIAAEVLATHEAARASVERLRALGGKPRRMDAITGGLGIAWNPLMEVPQYGGRQSVDLVGHEYDREVLGATAKRPGKIAPLAYRPIGTALTVERCHELRERALRLAEEDA